MARRVTASMRWLLVMAAARGRQVFEVPKHRLDFTSETSAARHAQCGAPQVLPVSIRQRLHFYAMVSSEDPALLRHFLAFYVARGVVFKEPGRARIVVHPPLNMSNPNHRATHRILAAVHAANVHQSTGFSSEIKRDGANRYLEHLPEYALLMFPDLDEFFDTPSADIDHILNRYGLVLGHMVDRIAKDWSLARTIDKPLWTQYPRRCAATAALFHGQNTKWVLVPRSIRFATAHHLVEQVTVPPSLPFSHYRFTRASGVLLQTKRDLYVQRGRAKNRTEGRAHIYDVVMSYVERGGLSAPFRKKVRCGTACNS
jgi:hypothetical protein